MISTSKCISLLFFCTIGLASLASRAFAIVSLSASTIPVATLILFSIKYVDTLNRKSGNNTLFRREDLNFFFFGTHLSAILIAILIPLPFIAFKIISVANLIMQAFYAAGVIDITETPYAIIGEHCPSEDTIVLKLGKNLSPTNVFLNTNLIYETPC